METPEKDIPETTHENVAPPVIKNLFEDMNPHEHDQASYEKMTQKTIQQ